jgi:N-acetylmuramoyl-L-alanine amidase
MQVPGDMNQAFTRRRWRRKRLQRLARFGVAGVLSIVVAGCVIWRTRHHARHPAPIAQQTLTKYPDPPGIVIHSSMSPGVVHGVPIDAERLEHIHADDHPQWATWFEGKLYHIGYHYVILPDGTVQKGRPDHCIGCHAPHYNNWLGICVVGSFDPSEHHHWKPSRPTAAQIASLVALCERLMSEYHFSYDHVLRHRDTKQTWCPGRRFPYQAVIAQLRNYADLHGETRPPQPPTRLPVPAALTAAGTAR